MARDPLLGTIAEWASSLRLEAIPDGVRRGMKRSLGETTVGLREVFPFLKSIPLGHLLSPPSEAPSLSGVDFSRVTLPIGARVTLYTADGKAYQGFRHVPRGAGADFDEVAREKWRREAASLGPVRVAEVERLVDALDRASPRRLIEAAAA